MFEFPIHCGNTILLLVTYAVTLIVQCDLQSGEYTTCNIESLLQGAANWRHEQCPDTKVLRIWIEQNRELRYNEIHAKQTSPMELSTELRAVPGPGLHALASAPSLYQQLSLWTPYLLRFTAQLLYTHNPRTWPAIPSYSSIWLRRMAIMR